MDLKAIVVELIPHVAKQKVQVGNDFVVVDIPFNQCFVQCNGKRVAIYCGKANEPDKYLSFVEPFPQIVQSAIAEKVAAITGGVKSFNAPPPEEHEVTDSDDE